MRNILRRRDSLRRPIPLRRKMLYSLVLIFLGFCLGEFATVQYLKTWRGYDGKHLVPYEFDAYKNILPARGYVDTRGIRHNMQGFRRSTEVSRDKPDDVYRVFLMGGSTAYGLGCLWEQIGDFPVIKNSECIDTYLEKFLSDALPGQKIEVINAAITSTWTHHHLIYLNQTILKYDPDMVIFVDGRNDYFEYGKDHDQFSSYAYGEHAHLIMARPTIGSLAYANGFWLYRKSALAHVTFRAIRSTKRSLFDQSAPAPIDMKNALHDLETAFQNNALKMNERLALILKNEEISAVFVLQPLLVLERERMPLMASAERELFLFNLSFRPSNSEEFYKKAVDVIRPLQKSTVEKHGEIFMDGTMVFEESSDQVFTDYCHLTPKGNELLARRIAKDVLPKIQSTLALRSTQ